MAAIRLRTVVNGDGVLTIKGLSSLAGRRVDVVIRESWQEPNQADRYPLRGKPFEYRDPFKRVAEGDWSAVG